MIALVLSSSELKLLHHHYKLTTERNKHSLGSGPLGSGPIGPGSGYSVMPLVEKIVVAASMREQPI